MKRPLEERSLGHLKMLLNTALLDKEQEENPNELLRNNTIQISIIRTQGILPK